MNVDRQIDSIESWAMMKIAILDDEIKICKLIKKLIDWESGGFSFVGFAHDGITGLNLIRKETPDIVITDIRMPGLTGLELIEKARQENLTTQFIIISGYSQFEYAKNALQLDVSNYILKPIDEEELNKTLISLRDEIDLSQTKENQVKQQSEQIDILYREKQLLDIFKKPENYDVVPFFDNDVIYFIMTESMSLPTSSIVSIREPMATYGVAKRSNTMLDYLKEIAKNGRLIYTEIGIKKLLDYQYEKWFTSSDVLKISDNHIDPKPIHNIFNESQSFILSSVEYLNESDFIEAIDYLRKKIIEQPEIDAFSVYQNILKLVQSLEVQVNLFQINSIASFYQELTQLIKQADDFDTVIEMIKEKIINVIREIKVKHKDRTSSTITLIKEYINQHYTEDISLDKLSKVFDLSPSYLSQLFKNEVGISYIEYLTKKRIDYAKRLLMESEQSVGEICTMVGYLDQKHFFRTFKKHTKMSPTEYRKLYQ